MSKNTIKINGARLKELIEKSERTIYSIAIDSGYSRNLIAEAIRKGQASPVVVNCLKLYGIHPEEYELKEEIIVEEPRPEGEQLSIDDLASISRDALKEIVREALRDELLLAIDGDVVIMRKEDLKDVISQVIIEMPFVKVTGIDYDPKNQRFKLIANKEDLK